MSSSNIDRFYQGIIRLTPFLTPVPSSAAAGEVGNVVCGVRVVRGNVGLGAVLG